MKRTQIKRRPLSDTVLSSLEPEEKIYRVSDGNGLYFRVKPTGQKSWELRYKREDGKWSFLGLGTYPSLNGAQARKKVRQMQLDAAYNNEPIASKKAKKKAKAIEESKTFEKLALEWFETRQKSWDSKNAKRVLAALQLHVMPVFGQRQYTDISSMEWMNFFRAMEDRGIFEQTSKIRRNCADIYALAQVTGRAINNPIEGIHRFLNSKPAENYSHVSIEEFPELNQIRLAKEGNLIKVAIDKFFGKPEKANAEESSVLQFPEVRRKEIELAEINTAAIARRKNELHTKLGLAQ